MSFPFVASAVRLGTARGPRLAAIWHVAEGGGTVGYLSRQNPNGVSVHFVVEYSGRIVQMLRLDEMHSSIRTTAIRRTDDSDGFYGRTAARAVMGRWADTAESYGPNHASIGVEVEGFAKDGPNARQADAMAELWGFLSDRYPGIRSLGHRDFASYKACPGKQIPWERLGGHGPRSEDPDVRFVNSISIDITTDRRLPVKAGSSWRTFDGKVAGSFARDALVPVLGRVDSNNGRYAVLIGTGDSDLYPDGQERPSIVLVESNIALADLRTVEAPPPPDCSDTVAAAVALDRARARIVYD